MVNVDYISFSRCSSLHSSSLPSLTNDCLPHEEKQKATKLHHHGTVLSSTDKPSSSTSTCRRAVPLDPNSELRAVHASYTNSRVTRLLQVRAVAKQMAENKRKQVKDRKQRQQQQQQRNLDAQRFKMLSASLISECLELEQAKLHFGMAHHQALQTNLIQQQQNSNKQQQITQQNNTNNHRFNTALNQIKQSKQEKETERERKKQVKEVREICSMFCHWCILVRYIDMLLCCCCISCLLFVNSIILLM